MSNNFNKSGSNPNSFSSKWDFHSEVDRQYAINEEILRRQEDQARYDEYMKSQRNNAVESALNNLQGPDGESAKTLVSYAMQLRKLEMNIDTLGRAVMANKAPGQDKLIAKNASALAKKANMMRRVIDERISKLESSDAARGRIDILRDYINDIIDGTISPQSGVDAGADNSSNKGKDGDPKDKEPTAQDKLDAKFMEFYQAEQSGKLKDFRSIKKLYDEYHKMAYDAIQAGQIEAGYAAAQFGAFMDKYRELSKNNLDKNGEILDDEISSPEKSKDAEKFLSGLHEEWQKAYDEILAKDSYTESDIGRLVKLRNAFRQDGIYRSTINGKLDGEKFKPFEEVATKMLELEGKLRDKLLKQDKDPDLKNFGDNLPAVIDNDKNTDKDKDIGKDGPWWRRTWVKIGAVAGVGLLTFGLTQGNGQPVEVDNNSQNIGQKSNESEDVLKKENAKKYGISQGEQTANAKQENRGAAFDVIERTPEGREKLKDGKYDKQADPYFAQHPDVEDLFADNEIKESADSIGLDQSGKTNEQYKADIMSEDNPSIIQELLMTDESLLEAFGLTYDQAEELFDAYRNGDAKAFQDVAKIREQIAENLTVENGRSLEGVMFNSVYLSDVNKDGSDLNFSYAMALGIGGTTRFIKFKVNGVDYVKELRDQCGGQLVFEDGTVVEFPPQITEIPQPTPPNPPKTGRPPVEIIPRTPTLETPGVPTLDNPNEPGTPDPNSPDKPGAPIETQKNSDLKPQYIKDSGTILDSDELKDDIVHNQGGYADQTPDVSPGTESTHIDAQGIDNSPRVDVDAQIDQGAGQVIESNESRQQDLQNQQGVEIQKQGEQNANIGEQTNMTDIGDGIKIDQQGNVYLPDGTVIPYNGN